MYMTKDQRTKVRSFWYSVGYTCNWKKSALKIGLK